MPRLAPTLKALAATLLGAVAFSGTATAADDLLQPTILVASSALDGSPFERTVVLATPLGERGHIGFIINKPIGVTLGTLFPDDTATQAVTESAYLGGPALSTVMFAVTRDPPPRPNAAIPLMPGLFAVADKDAIDHVIRTTPNEARYFLGLVVWVPGELESEVSRGLWDVRPANADTVLRAKSRGLWDSLRGVWANGESRWLAEARTEFIRVRRPARAPAASRRRA